MTLYLAVPLLFLIVGALVYALAANPKLSELGRLSFAAGAIGLCVEFAHRILALT